MIAPYPSVTADDVRAELAALAPGPECDQLAELGAMVHAAGALHLLGRGRIGLHLDFAGGAVARRAFSLLRGLGIEAEIRTYRRRAFDQSTRYQLHVHGTPGAVDALATAGILDRVRHVPLPRPPLRVVRRTCCRGAYLRGALLAGGSLSGGRAPHLELRTATPEGSRFIVDVAARSGITLAFVERDSSCAAYAKRWETIEATLALCGAVDAVVALEERALIASARGEANRLANADHGNLIRTARAARKQLAALRTLTEAGAVDDLPDSLREAAALRLRYPAASLGELARRTQPPSSKAAMHRRLTRIVSEAEPYRR